MRLSRYFHELHDGYLSEIDDLRSDSDGQDVLERRLRDKRREFDAICGLIDTDPLMLAPALHGAFRVAPGRVRAIERLLAGDPDGFPAWAELSAALEVASWARPLVERALQEDAGETFLATVVGLEHLLANQRGDAGRGARGGDREAADDDGDRARRDGDSGDDADARGDRLDDDRRAEEGDGRRRGRLDSDDDGDDDGDDGDDDRDTDERVDDFLERQGFDRRNER